MDTDLQSIFATFQFGNYLCAALVTAIAHDYILTFPREVDYVWKRPWTWMSTLFLLVRYLGPAISITSAFYGSALMAGTLTMCTVLFEILVWGSRLTNVAASLVMVLRVYAIYHGSRIVIGILLTSYILTIIVDFVATGIIYKSPEINVSVVFGTTICTLSIEESPNLNIYYYLLPSGIFNVFLCGLAVAQFVRESLQMHKATTRWRSNRYLELLVKGSVMYFVAVLFTNIAYLLSGPGTVILEGLAPFMTAMVSSFSSAVLPARLILSVRGGHSRIVGGHVDTGFGVNSHRLTSIDEHIVFARPASEESTENLANNINYGAEEILDVV